MRRNVFVDRLICPPRLASAGYYSLRFWTLRLVSAHEWRASGLGGSISAGLAQYVGGLQPGRGDDLLEKHGFEALTINPGDPAKQIRGCALRTYSWPCTARNSPTSCSYGRAPEYWNSDIAMTPNSSTAIRHSPAVWCELSRTLCDFATEPDSLRDSFTINHADLVVDMHALSQSLEAVAAVWTIDVNYRTRFSVAGLRYAQVSMGLIPRATRDLMARWLIGHAGVRAMTSLYEHMHSVTLYALGYGSAELPVHRSGERHVLALLEKQPGDLTVFDVGAHQGAYAVIAREQLGSRARIHCFDPIWGTSTCSRSRRHGSATPSYTPLDWVRRQKRSSSIATYPDRPWRPLTLTRSRWSAERPRTRLG